VFLQVFRTALPAALLRNEFLSAMESNKVGHCTPHFAGCLKPPTAPALRRDGVQVILLSGETGSGKTTQIPQYILEHAALQ
jgi:hypothetical protein